MYLDLEEDFETACRKAGNKMNKLKNSLLPPGFFLLLWYYSKFLPQAFVNYINHSGGKKHSLIISNVPGFVKPTHYGGGPIKKFWFLGTGTANLTTFLSVVSMHKRCQISIVSDISQIEDIDAF